MANVKNRITLAEIDTLKAFALKNGATIRPGKGDYQACQIQWNGHWNAVCFSLKGNVSTPETLNSLIDAFHFTQSSPQPAPVLVPMIEAAEILERGTPHSSAELYAADLRDDVALRLYAEILPYHDIDDPVSDDCLTKMAREAYRRADFLLAAGGHA